VLARIGEKEFAQTILRWFDLNRRALPWRETKDPYLIWISEVILQQTRVAQGLAYYKELTNAFPAVSDLAKAKEERVLRLWQGLGYYSRARNLHRCARVVVKERAGKFPERYDELLRLPGIGPYTAAAIASIAFDERVAVVDGNVYRILSRIFGIDADIQSSQGRKLFHAKASALVPEKRAGDFNQAMMELGAIQCTPRKPDCSTCPFGSVCMARSTQSIHLLPVKERKARVRNRFLNYFMFFMDGKVGLRARREKDIWNGLYDFHLLETARPVTTRQLTGGDELLKSLKSGEITWCGDIKHQLTHQLLHISFYQAVVSKKILTKIRQGNPALAFYSAKQVDRLPKPVPVKAFLERMKKERRGK
jgi:A/G-specific adenine glycosylase